MSNLSVGQNKQFATVAAAIAASRDGDIISIDAGTYVNDFSTINTKITLQGVGGMVKMVATVPPPNGKGILVTNTDVTINHLEFSGTTVPDNNGAGIRYQAGNLTVLNSYFHDNQNGILANADPTGTITIRNSEFNHNGAGDGRSHNIYVGAVASLNIDNSFFHDAVVGHEIKSRALSTTITNSRIAEGPEGTGSYSIDLPNGGRGVISNNVIEQGPRSGNPVIVAFGEEGSLHAATSLDMSGNTVLNDLSSPSTKLLWNATAATATLSGNSVFGLSAAQYGSGPIAVSGMTVLAREPALDTSSPWAAPALAPAPTPVPVTAAPAPAPAVSLTPLAIKLGADSWLGKPIAIVKVDGVELFRGEIAASHASGGQLVQLGQVDAARAHGISVEFPNDAWGGTAATDRNLYVENVLVNGIGTGKQQALMSAGTASFSIDTPSILATAPAPTSLTSAPAPATTSAPAPTSAPTPAPAPISTAAPTLDIIKIGLSGDAWNGAPKFVVLLDGVQQGGERTATALHSQSQTEFVTLSGDFADGAHNLTVRFLNDAWGGTPDTDRNLYVESLEVNGINLQKKVALMSSADASFGFTLASAAPGFAATAGTGPDSLVLAVSQDAYKGDAQFQVFVDDHQVGGTYAASASHGQGATALYEFRGTFGPGSHDVKVRFLNDLYEGTAATDRNLYVDHASFNGADLHQQATLMSAGDAHIFF